MTIEKGTAFGNWVKKGKLTPVDEEYSAKCFERLMELLENAGYEHYEISNFAKSGFKSRHNTSYWEQKTYLGLGPSAHSFDGKSRQYNVANNLKYLKALKNDQLEFSKEVLSDLDKFK